MILGTKAAESLEFVGEMALLTSQKGTATVRAAVATGIAPNDLMDTPPIIFDAMCEILNRRTQ